MAARRVVMVMVLSWMWRESESWWFLGYSKMLEPLEIHPSLNATREIAEEIERLVAKAELVVSELSDSKMKPVSHEGRFLSSYPFQQLLGGDSS